MKKEVFVILAIVLVAFLTIFFSGDPQKLINGNILKDFNNKEIILSGNEILEIKDSDYVFNNNIKLKDNSKLIIKNSVITHNKDYTFQYSVEAYDKSQIIVENSTIQTPCTGSFNWIFFDNSMLNADNIKEGQCNIWMAFTDNSMGKINHGLYKYGGFTICENSTVILENSVDVELELCYPKDSIVNQSFSSNIDYFEFPDKDDFNVNSKFVIINSTVSEWGTIIPPNSTITIKDAEAFSISVVIGLPLKHETVIIEDLQRKYYQNKEWKIADSKLNLISTTIYGWEPNVFSFNNTLIIRNSNFTGSTMNSDHSKEIIENSTVNIIRTQEYVEMTLINSEVITDVIATENSTIYLINTKVNGRIIEKDNGKVRIIN